MRYVLRALLVVCVLSTAVYAAPPKFSGEIWGGSEVIPNVGPVNVYWVFDGGVFHEYIYYYGSDEVRLMTSGRYTACESQGKTTYTLNVTVPVVERSKVPATDDAAPGLSVHAKLVQVPLTRADGYLTMPRGDRLTRVESFTQFVQPVEHPPSATGGKLKPAPNINYDGCCGDCFAVHAFLGIDWLNGICCDSSCFVGGGGSSGGGGASGSW
jgi:uncharacterized membrane protein YgcG